MTRTLTTFAALVLAAATAGAQTPPPQAGPVRDRPPAPAATGSAAIRGRVLDAVTGSAVARARVRLSRIGPGSQPTMVVTDDSGVFAFNTLPAGSYMLNAEKATYLTGRYPESGQTLRTNARPLTLTDGQVLQNLAIPMYRGSAIAGRIVDSHGDPVEYAQVQVLRLPPSGRGRPQQRGGGSSNDLGEFRIAHLEPGRYYLYVTPRRENFMGPMNPVPPEVADTQPVPTYYPNALSLDQAQPITITRGASVTGLELDLIEGYAATVSGTVIDVNGQPVSCCGSITLRPIVHDMPNGMGTIGTGLKPDGTFQFRAAPGEYDVEAQMSPRVLNGPPPPNSQVFGRVRLTVASDISGVVITVGPGAKVSGKLAFDGTSPLPTIGQNGQNGQNGPGGFSFAMRPAPDGGICRSGRAELQPDLTFTLDGVFGNCIPMVNGNFGKWSVRSVQYQGKEMMDQPFVFETGQQIRDVQVILTDRRTELTLDVSDDTGTPTREFVALVFSTDRARWTDGSRYVRTYMPPTGTLNGGVTSFASGSFTSISTVSGAGMDASRTVVSGMPAGEYFAVAIDDVASESARDPALLELVARAATRVTLSDTTPSQITLRRFKLADLISDR